MDRWPFLGPVGAVFYCKEEGEEEDVGLRNVRAPSAMLIGRFGVGCDGLGRYDGFITDKNDVTLFNCDPRSVFTTFLTMTFLVRPYCTFCLRKQ